MTDAMIVSLRIRSWGATRTDREVGEEVARSKNAHDDAGRYVKNLVDKSALKGVRIAVQNLRDRHRSLTRVWDDDGRRLVPLSILPQYQDEIETLKGDFDNAVSEFVKEYEGLQEYARMTLGEMFNEQDYPSVSQIADRFSVDLDFEPVPDGKHAPSGYEEQVNKAVARRMKESNDALFHRIVGTLREVKRKLEAHHEREKDGDKRGRFRLTLIDEVREIYDLLPALNIEDDPFLDGIRERLYSDLSWDAEELRDEAGIRTVNIINAEDIINDIEQEWEKL